MESVVENKELTLKDITGVYIVKPVKPTYLREIDRNHNGAVMFDRAVYSYSAERDPRTGLVITGLTDNLAKEIEEAMRLKVGSLSPYNMKVPPKGSNEFSWATFRITIPKEGLVIDASRSAKDKLQLLVLQAGSRVAKSTSDLAVNPVLYELVLISQENEARVTKTEQLIKQNAYVELSKMSLQDQMEFLSVYGEGKYKVGKSSSPDFIQAEIGKIVDKEPQKFLDTLNSNYYKTMIFLSKCINAQLVNKVGSRFELAAGGDVIGNTYLEAINNLQSEDYQGMKISLLAKLESR